MKRKNFDIKIDETIPKSFFSACIMADRDFCRLSEFIERELGIKMPPVKQSLLESRLQKRLRFLQMNSFAEYCDYVFSPEGSEDELIHMIDLVTTNKTDFFRESAHFDFLEKKLLPHLSINANKKLIVWSAGCSTGEEPYTLAMVISNFFEHHPAKKRDLLIIATDISTRVLDIARRGIYSEEKIEPVPQEFKKAYLMKSVDRSRRLVRVAPELRSKLRFRRLNLMDEDFGFREHIDIIFCRNVIIYFDKPTQERLLNKYHRHLADGGYLFLGHSETIQGLNVPFVQVAPTIYKKV